MAEIILINPADQPTGAFRLLKWLESNFDNPDYNEFRLAVAFSKINPFLKLDDKIQDWKKQGKSMKGIFGIDHKGTSYQALDYALNNLTETYVLYAKHSTFHPKLYMFFGDEHATFFYGSNNMTPGGIETNFEGGTIITFNINDEPSLFDNGINCFDSLLPSKLSCSTELNEDSLTKLFKASLLLNEADPKNKRSRKSKEEKEQSESTKTINEIFGEFSTKAPRAVPKKHLKPLSTPESGPVETLSSDTIEPSTSVEPVSEGNSTTTSVYVKENVLPVSALIIQIIPHHNGEILLSKKAVNQYPEFFGFPFTGSTVPKKSTNTSYPQRDPDPIVNIYIYDSTGTLVRKVEKYSLNTVYYEVKSEIRITITPEILSLVPEYSILVMSEGDPDSDYDYDLEIFSPGSPQYSDYLDSCDQQLPSGGKPVARRMGWI